VHIFTTAQYLSFIAASVLITFAPGPDNLAIIGLGLSRGRKAGMGFALGCALGCLTHTTWATLGVAAVIAASPVAFQVMKMAGATYLFYLGIKALRSGGSTVKQGETGEDEAKEFIRRGFIANSLNPKVALFFLAFLPQFVNQSGSVAVQMALLGLTFTMLTIFIFVTLGHFSGQIGGWLRGRKRFSVWMDRATGCLFIGLGLKLALFQHK